MTTYFVGIDPGKSGSMCILSTLDDIVEFYDFETIVKYISTIDRIGPLHIAMVGVESVHAMPGQGVKSMFTFGQRLGEIEGMLRTFKVGYDLIRPQLWQKECKVVPKSGKKGVYDAISKLYPNADLKGPKGGVKDGRCDALGIAHYIRKTYQF